MPNEEISHVPLLRRLEDIEGKVFKGMYGPYERKRAVPTEFERHIDEKFAKLPSSPEPMRYTVKDIVLFPSGPQSDAPLVPWIVVRAEKGHYLFERPSEDGKYHHEFCKEKLITVYHQQGAPHNTDIATQWANVPQSVAVSFGEELSLNVSARADETPTMLTPVEAQATSAASTTERLEHTNVKNDPLDIPTAQSSLAETGTVVTANIDSPPVVANDNTATGPLEVPDIVSPEKDLLQEAIETPAVEVETKADHQPNVYEIPSVLSFITPEAPSSLAANDNNDPLPLTAQDTAPTAEAVELNTPMVENPRVTMPDITEGITFDTPQAANDNEDGVGAETITMEGRQPIQPSDQKLAA